MRQSATVFIASDPHLRFSTSRFGRHYIIYQSTCDPKFRVNYCNPREYRIGEIFG